jgi:hypothetical protein
MLVGLQTADHIRLASPVQEAEGAPAAGDRTRILRLPMGEQIEVVALRFPHHRWRVFSALLKAPHPCSPSLGGMTALGAGPGQASLTFSAARSVFFWTEVLQSC